MELSFKLKKTTEFIYDYLTNMEKFESVHPVISKIASTDTGSYRIHETLKLWGIPFSFKYPVQIEENAEDQIVTMHAIVFKLTKIDMTFTLKQEQDYTAVHEHIQFRSPFPIKSIMKKVFREQHEQLFKNIAAQ